MNVKTLLTLAAFAVAPAFADGAEAEGTPTVTGAPAESTAEATTEAPAEATVEQQTTEESTPGTPGTPA